MSKASDEHVEFQEYTDYIDTSDAMLGYYKQQSGGGLEKYILTIEDWLDVEHANVEDNKPLVIQAESGIGKKTLISKWYEYHESTRAERKKDLILLHFATTGGNNSNYFYALYRILVKLRETLNIGQKVELHQEKLRKYFAYWLQLSNDTLESQAINSPDVIYDQIILVFEGIDHFVDRDTNKQGNIAFWLPKYFPKRVKVIVTTDRQSQTMKHFTRLGCQKIRIPVDSAVTRSMVRAHSERPQCIAEPLRGRILGALEETIAKEDTTSLYVKTFLSTLLPENAQELQSNDPIIEQLNNIIKELDVAKLKSATTLESLLDFVLEFWGKHLFKSQQTFKDLMGLFVCTQKGLTRSEIMMISKVSSEELRIFSVVFREFVMSWRHLRMIKNDSFRKALHRKYRFKVQEVHDKIAEALRRTPNSLRKLEEETYQLYNAKSYFKLKEIISDVENFLLLFNSYNKYDLCRYWQKLQAKSFDPVIQYNKAVESFQMHYHPSSEDLFRITVQISRFLKEFADFQTYYTPRFRHPDILGNLKDLNEIGLLGEFMNLGLCEAADPQPVDDRHTDSILGDKDLKDRVQQMVERLEKGKAPRKEAILPPASEEKRPRQKGKKKQLSVQQYNVEVKSNQANFREHYYKQIQGFLKKVALDRDNEDSQPTPMEEEHSEQQEDEREPLKGPGERQKVRQYEFENLRRLFSEAVEQEFELNQHAPTNYYYKRWIWMQFPWVCMTMKCDYSAKIRRCFTSPTEYMTVAEQKEFTTQSLKIALEAKKKKQSVLEQKSYRKDEDKNKSYLVKPYDRQPLSKADQNSRMDHSRKKMDEIAYLTNSFLNLQKLTQEMQSITSTKAGSKPKVQEPSVFLTQGERSGFSDFTLQKNSRRKPTTHEELVSTKIRQGLLPRIKHSMNNEMQRELEALEKNNASMRREMDAYLYANRVLAKKLKELKVIELNNMSQVKNVRKIDQTKEKVAALETRLAKIREQYAYSLLQQERLNILIKICKHNKTQNEQAIPPLTFECSNFKKMIRWEKQAIEQITRQTEEIRKISSKFLLNCSEKLENQLHLSEQIRSTLKNRSHFDSEVEKYDSLIQHQVEAQRRRIDQEIRDVLGNRDHRDPAADKTKKTDVAEHYDQLYKDLSTYLPLDNEAYKTDARYLWLLEQLNKKREFEAIIEQRKLKLEQLTKKYREDLHELQTFEKANDDVPEPVDSTPEIDGFTHEQRCYALEREIHEKQRVYGKLLQAKLSCLGMLSTWCAKLGLPQPKTLQIPDGFLAKLEQLMQQGQGQQTASTNHKTVTLPSESPATMQ